MLYLKIAKSVFGSRILITAALAVSYLVALQRERSST
jgi:hypothetical protein